MGHFGVQYVTLTILFWKKSNIGRANIHIKGGLETWNYGQNVLCIIFSWLDYNLVLFKNHLTKNLN